MRPLHALSRLVMARRLRSGCPDLEPEFLRLYKRCSWATMTSTERMYALYQAVNYVVSAGVPGAYVECGVWRGGSSMLAALTLVEAQDERPLWLYDTFEGMVTPTERDVSFIDGAAEGGRFAEGSLTASLAEVKANMLSTGIDSERLVFVQGRVEDTLPGNAPAGISVLRLDTDWFESTYHELRHLFPLLATGGVLIIDDYGHWQGAREAVDQYFQENDISILLNRIDYTGRLGIKCL